MRYLLVFLLTLLSRLPLALLYVLGNIFYFLMIIIAYRRKVIIANLKNSFPDKGISEIELIRRAFYKNLSDVLIESLKSITISKSEIQRRVKFTNPEIAEKLYENKKRFITMASHQGNWEWQLLGASAQGFKIDAVYQRLTNSVFDNLMLKVRAKFGANMVESNQILRHVLKNQEITGIAMVGDQTPQKSKIDFWTTFMHQETPFFTGAEKLAKKLNFPVLFMEMKRVQRGYYEITLHQLDSPPYSKEESFTITPKYANLVEECILKQPANWLWSHRRWKHQKD